MGKAPQNIDTAPMLHLIIAGVIGVVLFFVGIILSFAGPDPDIITSTTLYQCPGSQHKWEKDKCKGPQNLTSYTVEFLHLRVAGGYWGLVMQPYRKVAEPAPKKDSMVKMTLNAEVVAYNTDSKGIWTNKKVTNETYTFKCHTKSNEGRCEPLIVKHSNKIRHSGLKFTFTFNDASEVGDVIFRQERGNPKRASLVLSFDVIYILLAFFLFLAFGYFMKDFPLSEWTLNQKFVVFLAFGFILYNAPFLSLDYALRSTFLVFIGTLFRILFIGLLFFYWMLYAYSLRSNDPFTFKNKLHIIQISMVAVYIVLSAIGFGWLK